MTKRAEAWKTNFEYFWSGWVIAKDKGWYSITYHPDTRPVRVPIRFKRLGDAKTYCETLDTLVDRKSLADEYQSIFDLKICAKAAKQVSLDSSLLLIADELWELAGEFEKAEAAREDVKIK